jgi:hypothetical protein
MKKPRWDCRNESERKYFEEWTNSQLSSVNLFPEVWGDVIADQELLEEQSVITDQEYKALDEWNRQTLGWLMPQVRISSATQKKDWAEVQRICRENPAQWPFAYAKLVAAITPRQGRPKDAADTLMRQTELETATRYVEAIRDLWKREFGIRNRSMAPKAIAIAARRCELTEVKLINYMKNRRNVRKNR